MAAPTPGTKRADKGLPELARELLDLTVAYAKQETVEPLKGARRAVAMGVLGSLVASVGLVLLLVGTARVVQTEARLGGLLSWVPYAASLAVALLVAAFALRRISGPRGGRR